MQIWENNWLKVIIWDDYLWLRIVVRTTTYLRVYISTIHTKLRVVTNIDKATAIVDRLSKNISQKVTYSRIHLFPILTKQKLYRVTHQVVPKVFLTSKQKLHFTIRRIYWNTTFVLVSTKPREQPDGSHCIYKPHSSYFFGKKPRSDR